MDDSKQGLIAALRECALLMELAGENPFRCRAYEQGARQLESVQGEPAQWLETGALKDVRGIGKGILEKVEEWAQTGQLVQLGELHAKLPPGLIEMMRIPGLGPKKIKALWDAKGLDTLEKLEAAAKAGELNGLPGFGERTAEKILEGIEQRRRYSARHTLEEATEAAERLLDRLRTLKVIGRLEAAGSLRRRLETVKDIDLVATSREPEAVMKVFVETPGVESVVAHGPTKSSVLMAGGIPVDLRVVEESQFAAALNYFSGSKLHNTALRGRAKRMGYKLNEYGLFREKEGGAEELVATPDEEAIYKALGLPYIPPELREDMGEIEAAERGELPKLIGDGDLRGVLHCHTIYSDGHNTVAEMGEACRRAGYRYLGICDHSQSAAYARGLKPDALARQAEEIDLFNQTSKGFRLLKGIESDILEDGSLDYDEKTLARLDVVVASIHSRMSMDREAMTRRICRALEHPATAILGHPTGRLLLRREPYAVDIEQVFEMAARHGVAIEINANPWRLDLDWRLIRQARQAGCRFAICPDAHAAGEIEYVRFGVGIARKGWLTAQDVVNTRDATGFEEWLKERATKPHEKQKKKR